MPSIIAASLLRRGRAGSSSGKETAAFRKVGGRIDLAIEFTEALLAFALPLTVAAALLLAVAALLLLLLALAVIAARIVLVVGHVKHPSMRPEWACQETRSRAHSFRAVNGAFARCVP